ncbi:hypothetical protein DSO57_1017707 [Entomophthora muscae]|uniref:Uncharacterized protein n=1 Tax=Entomophthora muscae TaxID=34485 RepID=A0ACC2U2C5_9FUNG|nr:hypothetical protein DSO57_1017707 [Entomophthora muscae]
MDDINLFNKKVREPSNSGSIDHSQQSAQDDYDPSNPYVGSHHRGYSRGSHSYRGHRGGFQNSRGRGNSHYSGFSSYPPRENLTVSRTTLSLENIPSDKYSQGAIKEYFERFGEVASVTVDRHQPKAEVEFKTEESAQKANTSPEPIFGNRFVKLYWKRIPAAYTPTPQEHRPTPGAPKPDTELLRKQRLLHKKKTELVSKQLEEQKKLLALVENPSLSEADRKSILASLSNVTKLITETLASLSKSTALQKADAMETGDSVKPTPAPAAVKKPILRGGFGANKWVPGMTTPHTQYNLDNRPKAFKITGFEASKRDLVESHLKSIRGIDVVKLDADNVTFQIECKNHYLAKRAQAEALKMGDMTFRTSWVASSPQPASVSAPVTNQ